LNKSYLFKEGRSDESRNFDVELGKGSIDSPQVGKQFVLLEDQPHFRDDSVDLAVQLHAK